jgi:hypothetical protein
MTRQRKERRDMKSGFLPAFAVALAALPQTLAAAAPAPAAPVAGEKELSSLIARHLRSGGSWFTPAEREVIERKCGYAPGEWDGFEANVTRGTFTCTNGRVVDDPEMRTVLRAAEPRIRTRVEAMMARADVRAAISRVAEIATAKAMREVEARRER